MVGFRQIRGLGRGRCNNISVVNIFEDEDKGEEGQNDDFGGKDAFQDGGLLVRFEID